MSKSAIVDYVAAHPGCSDHDVYKAVAQGMPRHFFWNAVTALCAKGVIRRTGVDAVRLYPVQSSSSTEPVR